MENEIPEAEIDGLLDWYDQALANGQGFKSEEEREKYFADLGDPLKHPLWAESMEDLEGNPMVEAFRLLREEDKTKVELVMMYKDEGNEFMRKKTVKERHEAIKRYSHALSLLDNADTARREGTEDEADKSVNLHHLRSQLFNNRAMALMFLKNYGLALKDLTMVHTLQESHNLLQALLYHPENIKAHYRKSKVLYQLKRPELALKACDAGLSALESTSPLDKDSERELLSLKEQCVNEIERLRRIREAAEEVQREKELLWRQAWQIANARGVKMGATPRSWKPPPQLITHMPFYTSPNDLTENWPLVVLYPQYSQIDVIQGTSAETMLVMLLAEMFPEDEGNGVQSVPWDIKGEYHVSNLRVFIQLKTAVACQSEEEWITYLRSKDLNSEPSEDENQDYTPDYHMELLEVHLGCTIQQILTTPDHILPGGTLTLTIYPSNSEALTKFLKRYDNCYQLLQPNGVRVSR